jgi:MFS family permease
MFRFLEKRAKARHINNLLIMASFGIATTPLLWTITQNYYWIMFIEFLSGCYWAGFELATVLLYYQKIEDHERTSIMSYITFFNISGMVIGSLIGAGLMKLFPENWDTYLTLFMISTFLRTLVVFVTPHISFRGRIPNFISYNRVFMARPPFGALTRPILDRKKKTKDN